MKRKDLVVGQEYAAFSGREDPRWRRVSRVKVLHSEPWERHEPSVYSRRSKGLFPSPDKKGSGVHVSIQNGVPPPGSYRRHGDEVVQLGAVQMLWLDWEVAEAEEKRVRAEQEAERDAANAAYTHHLEAILAVLEPFGVERVHAPLVQHDGSHGWRWNVPLDAMERIAEALKKGQAGEVTDG